MSEIPEKQIKRLRSLISEAETNLSAAKELLVSILGDGETIAAPRDTVVSGPEGMKRCPRNRAARVNRTHRKARCIPH